MVTTASSIHNRGTFQLEQTMKSGDSSKDRQSGGETYMPYQQGDQVQFRQTQTTWQPEAAQASTLSLLLNGLFGLDTRVFTSAIAALIFATLFHALFTSPLLSIALGFLFFVVWYVMSFFNFQRVIANAQHGPRQTRHMHHQVSATF
jgi:hypothetical protein